MTTIRCRALPGKASWTSVLALASHDSAKVLLRLAQTRPDWERETNHRLTRARIGNLSPDEPNGNPRWIATDDEHFIVIDSLRNPNERCGTTQILDPTLVLRLAGQNSDRPTVIFKEPLIQVLQPHCDDEIYEVAIGA